MYIYMYIYAPSALACLYQHMQTFFHSFQCFSTRYADHIIFLFSINTFFIIQYQTSTSEPGVLCLKRLFRSYSLPPPSNHVSAYFYPSLTMNTVVQNEG